MFIFFKRYKVNKAHIDYDNTIKDTFSWTTQLVWDADEVKLTMSPWHREGTYPLALMSEPLSKVNI